MTRKSRREIERALDELDDSPADGIATVTFREWRVDESGEPTECVDVTECEIDADAPLEIEFHETIIPTDWERGE